MLGNNMFAYCGGNPVIRRDDSGENYVLSKADMRSNGGFYIPNTYALIGIGITAGAVVENAWDDIKQAMNNSLARVNTLQKYRSATESHHIAAKGSYKAAEARAILEELFPQGVESPANKVDLLTRIHRRVHTNLYYATVNSIIVYAYETAGDDKAKAASNVTTALETIRAQLLLINELGG